MTANKAVVALRMKEIIDLLKVRRECIALIYMMSFIIYYHIIQVHPDVHFHFGAAVCGGLPIITLLRRSLRYDNISCISGILNGTTNYILTQMECHSKSFPQVIAFPSAYLQIPSKFHARCLGLRSCSRKRVCGS